MGRRNVMLIAAALFVVGALIQGLTSVHALFVAARFAGGMAVGAASVLSPLYISAVAPANIRGRLSTLPPELIIKLRNAAGGDRGCQYVSTPSVASVSHQRQTTDTHTSRTSTTK